MKYEIEDPPAWAIPVLLWVVRIIFFFGCTAIIAAILHKAGVL